MGTFRVPMEIRNRVTQQAETVEALVDTGARYSMAPASLLHRLGIEAERTMRFRVATGDTVNYPTGAADFLVEGLSAPSRLTFGPDGQYLLGAVTLQELSLVVDPGEERLIPEEELSL